MERNGTLDHARLLAAFGIVFFHAGAPGAAVGYAGLPFFLILLVAIAMPATIHSPFGSYAAARARRLLTPWLIWSLFYGALKLAELAVTGAPFATEFAPYMILTGPALHLWFLPFAFIICLAAYPVMRLASLPLSMVLVAAGLSTPLSRRAAAAAMGVYLVHPLVLSLLERITPLARDSVVMALLGCAVALTISLCLLLVTTRYNSQRDQIPHEQVLARPLNSTF